MDDIGLLKMITMMRFTIFILFLSLSQTFAVNSYSQQTKLSLDMRNARVEDIIDKIEKNSQFFFMYNKNMIDVDRKLDLKVEEKSINQVLDKVFENTDVSYLIKDRQILLINSRMAGAGNEFINQQQKSVSGKVSDNTGAGLPGVSVVVKGTITGVITDANGTFSFANVPSDATLVFSFVGMKMQEVIVAGKTSINITMQDETIGIDEVVAIGYGTQKKESLTGAISNIVSKDIQTTSSTSLAQKLSGKVAGLNIRQNTGEPGNFDNSINIRGFGTPLYVIDGIARGGSADFQRLNSEDIESISILKDASAAIYGLNAANGVIIVTTKKGGSGKTKFTFGTTTGFSSPTDIPAMANAAQYYEMRNDANINEGLAPFISKEELAKWKEGGPGYESTNWADETFKKYAVRKEHNLSAQGGNDKVSYYVNAGAVDEGSILRSNDLNYNKFNFRSNLTANLAKNLTANINIAGFIDKKTEPVQSIFNIWRGTVSALPINTPYANDNPEYLRRVQDGQSMNPVAISQIDLTGYSERANTTLHAYFN